MGGNLSSHKYKPSKYDKGEDSSSKESIDANVSRKKKKHRKKKLTKNEKVKAEDAEKPVKKKSSFSKKINSKPKKKKSKHDDKGQTGFNDIESDQITFPKIIISSPSDVEASLDKDSHERCSNRPDNNVTDNLEDGSTYKNAEITLINNNVETKESDKYKDDISDVPAIHAEDTNPDNHENANGKASSAQHEDPMKELVEAESSVEISKNYGFESSMNKVSVSSYTPNIDTKSIEVTGVTNEDTIEQIHILNNNALVKVGDDIPEEHGQQGALENIVIKERDSPVSANELNGTLDTKQSTCSDDKLEKDLSSDQPLSLDDAFSEANMPPNVTMKVDVLTANENECFLHPKPVERTVEHLADVSKSDAIIPKVTEETKIQPTHDSTLSQSNPNEEELNSSCVIISKPDISRSDVTFINEVKENDENNDTSTLLLQTIKTVTNESVNNIEPNLPFIDETLPANVITNSLLTTRAESMSSIDRDFSAEEINKQQKESQMVSEQEAWEKEETLKKEQMKKLREIEEQEHRFNEQYNGNMTPKSATYEVEGSPLPKVPKSAPPVASKPSYKELSSAPGSYRRNKEDTESPMLSAAPHERMSFRDRRKYFEKEIKQQSIEEPGNNGSIGRRKKISLVSDQDLRTIKQEEEKKYGTLSKDDIRKSLDIAEEDEDIVEELSDIPTDIRPNSTVFIEGKEYKVEKKPQKLSARERLNPQYNNPASASSEEDLIRTLEQDVERAGHMIDDGEDAEDGNGALNERLKLQSPGVRPGHDLSPAERRALEAEKRKQWRQARFQSLEADALQAQMMLQQRGRKSDTLSGASGSGTRALS